MNALLAQIVNSYDALQSSEGASTYLDTQRTFTAGQWLGRMAGLIDQLRPLAEQPATPRVAIVVTRGRFVCSIGTVAVPLHHAAAAMGRELVHLAQIQLARLLYRTARRLATADELQPPAAAASA